MKIKKDTWHAKLYMYAYVNDREWVNGDVQVPIHDDIPELVELREFKKKTEYIFNDEQFLKAHEVRKTKYEAAYKSACVELLKLAKAERAKEVEEQFLGGRLALCPYFWKVVAACFIYTLFVRPERWAAEICGRNAKRIGWATCGVLALIGGVIVEQIGEAAVEYGQSLPDRIPAYLKQRAQEKAYEANLERQEKANEELYQQERKAEEADNRACAAIYNTEQDKIKATWAHEKWEEVTKPWLLAWSWSLLAGIGLLFIAYRFLRWFWSAFGERILLTVDFLFLVFIAVSIDVVSEITVWRRLMSFLRSACRVLKDTWALGSAMFDAVYRKHLCPYLDFVEEDSAEPR